MDETIFEGTFKDDKISGKGKKVCGRTGDRYEGDFVDWMLEG